MYVHFCLHQMSLEMYSFKKWFGSEVEQVLTKWETEETAISTIATPKTPNTGSHELCIHPSFIGIDGAR